MKENIETKDVQRTEYLDKNGLDMLWAKVKENTHNQVEVERNRATTQENRIIETKADKSELHNSYVSNSTLQHSRRRLRLILMLLVISRMLVTILVMKLLIMKDITKYRIFVFLVAAAILKQTQIHRVYPLSVILKTAIQQLHVTASLTMIITLITFMLQMDLQLI